MIMKRARSIVMMCGLLAAAAAPAAAQGGATPKAEVAGGYQWLHGKSETLKKGWFADLAVNANRAVSVDLQVDGSYDSMSDSVSSGGVNVSLNANHHVYHVMGGVRFNNRKDKAATAFAHVLAGVQRQSASGTATATGSINQTASASDAVSDFAVEAGGGVNIRLGSRAGLRIGGDYIRVFSDPGLNIVRVTAGVVIPIGSK